MDGRYEVQMLWNHKAMDGKHNPRVHLVPVALVVSPRPLRMVISTSDDGWMVKIETMSVPTGAKEHTNR